MATAPTHTPAAPATAAATDNLPPGPDRQEAPYALGKGSTPDPALPASARTWRDVPDKADKADAPPAHKETRHGG